MTGHEFRGLEYRAPEQPKQFRLARDGAEPADALTPHDRRLLVELLHELGWTDLEISRHTRMTLYTTARLRDELWLRPNPEGAHSWPRRSQCA